MFFKNVTLFRLSEAATQAAVEAPLSDKLAENPLRSVGPLEQSTHGFVSPFGDDPNAAIVHAVGNGILFTVGGEHRLLPGSVVNEALRKRVAKIESEEQRKVSRKERKSLKEEVLTDLLPKAFVKPSRANGYLDTKNGWVVLDTSSSKSAEALVSAVRDALGSFPAVPLMPEESPGVLMTSWVSSGELPEGLALGDSCELKDVAASPAATARVRNQELTSEEILEHLKAGKQVSQLALVFEERLSFTLTSDLVVKQIKFLDLATQSLGETSDDASELDARFALMSLEFDRLFERLSSWFNLARPID